MKKVIILGGGIAGLSAASFLAEKGFKTEIIESSPKLGGRAYSFLDRESGLLFDNGQHIMLGCYKETIKFLKLINAFQNIIIQKELEVKFLAPGFKEYVLKSSGNFYPFNLFAAILKFKVLTIGERFSLLRVFFELYFYSENDLKKRTVYEWLHDHSQSINAIKSFWEILCIGALNTSTENASAYIFVRILKEIFLKGSGNSLIVLPSTDLSTMYCDNAEKFIMDNNGLISKGETIRRLSIKRNQIISITSDKRIISDFDYIISTLPYSELKKIYDSLEEVPFYYSPIMSAHIITKENLLPDTFYGLINSKVHWIFNKGTHLSIVISSAQDLIKKTNEELKEIIISELSDYAGIKKDNISYFKVIKEKKATFIPSNDILDKRPGVQTNITNLFLAGDWVQTNLPATLEGAVLSAKIAVENILSEMSSKTKC